MKKLLTIVFINVLLWCNVALSKNLNLLCKAKDYAGKKYRVGMNIDLDSQTLMDDNNDSHKLYVNDRSFITVISKYKDGMEVLTTIKIFRSSGVADISLYPLTTSQMDTLFEKVDSYLESGNLTTKEKNILDYAVFLALQDSFKPESSGKFMCDETSNKF